MKRKNFIVIEGIDGSGKTTQSALLAENLNTLIKDTPTILQMEPTKSIFGQIIRKHLSGEEILNEDTITTCFVADRIEHIKGENGLLELLEHSNVVCDRYYYSSIAYNSVNSPKDYVISINKYCEKLLPPDILVYIKTDLNVSAERIQKRRGNVEHYEKYEIQQKVKNNYEQYIEELEKNSSNQTKIIIIEDNGTKSIEEVSKEILSQVEKYLRNV